MNKLIAVSLIALGIAGAALPAQAASTMGARVPFCDTTTDVSSRTDDIALALQGKGLNVQAVDEWAGCARAYVIKSDGSIAMEYFDPDTLAQVGV